MNDLVARLRNWQGIRMSPEKMAHFIAHAQEAADRIEQLERERDDWHTVADYRTEALIKAKHERDEAVALLKEAEIVIVQWAPNEYKLLARIDAAMKEGK